ncbi:MAG: bifunctional (p)ppGpp synthetase/guanosine-3',5'-bis(diphosphate) 3'-pyrophosphohydrolase [Clostridia bacterium]|nr:bifunctional (p)ppGpp synthetase/guanosine-3',5'-bis(diphosphate) 3'-pyrophosphohydrolase [Clostridia bacterium]
MDNESFSDKVKRVYTVGSCAKIMKAYQYAEERHRDQKRLSGEPYIVHPVAVAEILIDLGMDKNCIVAALLHDVIEDTQASEQEIKTQFGNTVVSLVQGVTKLSMLNFKSKEEEQAENYRRMFLAMSNDIRVIIIKLADRLHNMRTLSFKDASAQKRIAQETLDIYAPIAARLGIAGVKGELEDLALKFLHPEDYHMIVDKVAATKEERIQFVHKIIERLEKKLSDLNIRAEINGRPKHYYSIWRKMQRGKAFEEIYDLHAIRIIVDTIKDCYEVLGTIHTMWKPLPYRFKDYISVPKANLYQSLHTTVLSSVGVPFEIQIRTHEMHRLAEYGIAAHWKYKQQGSVVSSADANDKKLAWIRNVMELQSEVDDSSEFLDMLKLDLYQDQVYVFTPAGDVVNLPSGSTGVDFAYYVHSQVGNKCVGIKINSRMVHLDTKLENGDVVEVITSNSSKGPSRDWLNFVVTPSAKSKIRAFFKKEMKEDNIHRGKDMLEKESKRRGYNLNELISCEELKNYMLKKYNTSLIDEIYAMVGYGGLTTNQVVLKMIDCFKKTIEGKSVLEIKPSQAATASKKADSGVLVKGYDGFLIRFSHCCNPLPGDKIVGYISRGRGVSVHRADCPNIAGYEPERLIEASWPSTVGDKFSATISITGDDRNGLFSDIATTLNNMKVYMTGISAKGNKESNTSLVTVTLEVDSLDSLDSIINKLRSVRGVYQVSRKSN